MQEEDMPGVPMKSKGRRGPRGSGKFSTPFTTGATKALHACTDKHGGHEAPQAVEQSTVLAAHAITTALPDELQKISSETLLCGCSQQWYGV